MTQVGNPSPELTNARLSDRLWIRRVVDRDVCVATNEIAFNKLKHAIIRQFNRNARLLGYDISEVPESLSAF